MKTRYWVLLLAVLFLTALALSAWLLRPTQAAGAEIWSGGKLLYRLPLEEDRQLRVETESGYNVITVKDGKIGVTEADCPDGYCVARGFCDGGADIICLPNRLVIRFTAGPEVDAVVG